MINLTVNLIGWFTIIRWIFMFYRRYRSNKIKKQQMYGVIR